jgi:predicted Zn-dependent peptidase
LINEAPLEVFYIGATDADTVSSALLESFGSAHFGKEQRICKASPISRESFAEACEKMPVSQGKLAMCFSTHTSLSTDNDDYYVALMLNEIFGGSASSKLFLNVREKMSLCYYCSSSFSTYSGILTVSSGIEVKNFEAVRAAVIDQLEQIRKGNISESELYAAKRSIENAYRQLYDSPFDLQSFYSGRMLFGIFETIEDCRKKLMAVSREQIVALAKEVTLDALFFVEGTACGDDEEEEDE